jgi:hypothetical protein
MTDTHMCTDARGLNSITPPDRYCSCRPDDLVRRVRSATHISSIDLHSGFNQIPDCIADHPKLAFWWGNHLWQW